MSNTAGRTRKTARRRAIAPPAGETVADVYETRISGDGTRVVYTVNTGTARKTYGATLTLPSGPFVGLNPARLLDTRTGG